MHGPRETVQQNSRAESLINKHLANMLLISLKRSSKNMEWNPAAFFLHSWMVIKITVALFKEFEVCVLRLKCVQSIPISPCWSKTPVPETESTGWAFVSIVSAQALFSLFQLFFLPPHFLSLCQQPSQRWHNKLLWAIVVGLGMTQQRGSVHSFSWRLAPP